MTALQDFTRRVRYKVGSLAFRSSIPERVWRDQERWLSLSRAMGEETAHHSAAGDELIELAGRLRSDALEKYRNVYRDRPQLRVLIHVPDARQSMGGNSLYRNWINALRYMGVACEESPTGADIVAHVERFAPTLVFTSDHESYLQWFDWDRLKAHRSRSRLLLALTASAEHDGNTPAGPRLDAARQRGVDFFVSFRERDYIDEHLPEWRQREYDVLSIPFSANPLWQRYVPCEPKPLDYVFFGSVNPEKASRYNAYFRRIVRRYRGVINGPGWGRDHLMLELKHQPCMYALGAVGLNLHIPVSLDTLSEVNERTFILACCGAFQLCDAPLALRRFFPADAVPAAATPAEYLEMFGHFASDPARRIPFQREALKAVYNGHTVFHRMTILADHALSKLAQTTR